MRNIQIRLLQIKTKGIRNLVEEIAITCQKNVSFSDIRFEGDQVRAIYGPNGSGKTSFILSLWLLQMMSNKKDFFSSCGSVFLSNLLNKKSPFFSISLLFAAKAKEKKIGVYEYVLSMSMKGDSCRIDHEELNIVTGHSLNNYSRSPVFIVDNGALSSLDSSCGKDFDRLIEESSRNLLSSSPFIRLFVSILMEEGKAGYKANFLKGVSEESPRALAIGNLVGLLAGLSVFVDSDDKHWEYSNDSMRAMNELLGQFKNDSELFPVEQFRPYNQFSTIVPLIEIDSYRKSVKRLASFIQIFKPELREIELDEKIDGNYLKCRKVFVYDGLKLDFEFESTGIKKLANLFSYLESAAAGNIAFIDEMDANIAGPYLSSLVKFFNEYGKGQLIFTAHCLDPMDALSNNSKSIYFIGEGNEVSFWTKNGNYKPQILYPKGYVPGITFNIGPSDFVMPLLGEE